MKASDIEKVQSLLVKRHQLVAWLQEAAPKSESYIPHDPVVSLGGERLILDRVSDIGREVLALLEQHVADKIADIEGQLRAWVSSHDRTRQAVRHRCCRSCETLRP